MLRAAGIEVWVGPGQWRVCAKGKGGQARLVRRTADAFAHLLSVYAGREAPALPDRHVCPTTGKRSGSRTGEILIADAGPVRAAEADPGQRPLGHHDAHD